ncbi:MAG: hypothetical protein H7Z16_07450 [Pyrinomonadaceae bacterium]|nr:hypothetical protein [Pyrinomonadaceae bacterium]
MSQELNFSKEELDAVDRIDAELKGLSARGKGGANVASFSSIDAGDLCEKYHAIKGWLRILVKVIRKIPKIGDKAADAIEFLMGLADMACPV